MKKKKYKCSPLFPKKRALVDEIFHFHFQPCKMWAISFLRIGFISGCLLQNQEGERFFLFEGVEGERVRTTPVDPLNILYPKFRGLS